MSFMKPQVYETDYLYVDGPQGGEIIPWDVIGHNNLELVKSDEAFNIAQSMPWLGMYCQNTEAYTIKRCHGWIGRLSASGYTDCTEWTSGETEAEVRAELDRMYGDDNDEVA